jgi:hypothetical protein
MGKRPKEEGEKPTKSEKQQRRQKRSDKKRGRNRSNARTWKQWPTRKSDGEEQRCDQKQKWRTRRWKGLEEQQGDRGNKRKCRWDHEEVASARRRLPRCAKTEEAWWRFHNERRGGGGVRGRRCFFPADAAKGPSVIVPNHLQQSM